MQNIVINGVENSNYKADKEGNIYTSEGALMKQHVMGNGYLRVKLSRDCKRGMYLVHRIIAETFIKNEVNMPIVNHRDNNRANNRVDNLEWCDNSYNQKQRYLSGGHVGTKRKKVYQLSLSGKFIAEYDSPIDAEKVTGVARQNISKVCRGLRQSAGGYKWKY